MTTSNRGGAIALVASRKVGEQLAQVLGNESLEFDAFDDVPALLGARPRLGRPSLILVAQIEDAESGLVTNTESLVDAFEDVPVVLVCAAVERWELRALLMAGVAGVLLMESVAAALVPCLRSVQAGQICVPRAHSRQIEPPPLSSREKQILGLVVMGFMNSQIAEQLFLAESTVKSHLSSAFGKLGVRSRHEAVKLILDPERGLGMGILALGGEPVTSSEAK
jgi:DNA-binding NarL/FixJ family response regulator